MTTITLVQLMGIEQTMVSIIAHRVNKPLGPTPIKECFPALFFGAILYEEIRLTEAFLKLDGILFHRKPPFALALL